MDTQSGANAYFFPASRGTATRLGQLCADYVLFTIVQVIRFNRVSVLRRKNENFPLLAPPPRYAHAFFIFRIVGLAMQKAWTIYFNGCGIKRAGTSAVDDDRVAVEKQTS